MSDQYDQHGKKKRKSRIQKPQEYKTQGERRINDGKSQSGDSLRPAEAAENKNPEAPVKKAFDRLQAGSEIRKKLSKASGRRKSAAEKSSNRNLKQSKAEGRQTNKAEKQGQAERLKSQKAGLVKELAALNKMAQIRETVDSQYTVKFGAMDSAVAAGPRGAASGGLRKLTPDIAINLLSQQNAAKVQLKLDPKIAQVLSKLGKIARELKLDNIKMPSMGKSSGARLGPGAATQKSNSGIENSKLRSKIREVKEKEIMRDPNRNPSKFEELNMPFRGMG
jgi:hypothetical protein